MSIGLLYMKGFRSVAVICSLILFTIGVDAQENDKTYLSELTRSALKIFLNKPDSAIHLSKQALEIAIQNNDSYFEGYSYYLLSKAYWVKANYRLSTEYGFKALKVFQGSPHTQEHSSTLLSLARTLVELGNY